MDTETIWQNLERQRRSVADFLETLAPQQWDTPSLCEGWRVRDVAAHLTFAARARPFVAMVGVLRARGNVNRWIAEDARAGGDARPDQLLAGLRAVASVRRHPIGTKTIDPLVDVLVHEQDIAVPLGVERTMPVDAATAAADRLWGMGYPFHARRRLAGVELEATNASWREGSGPRVEGPIEALLLLLAGRTAALDRMEGPGVAVLASRP